MQSGRQGGSLAGSRTELRRGLVTQPRMGGSPCGYQLVTRTPAKRRQSAAIPHAANPLKQQRHRTQPLLAMQKVVGSSPISRLREARSWSGFFVRSVSLEV